MSFVWPELYFIRHGQTDLERRRPVPGARIFPRTTSAAARPISTGTCLMELLGRDGRSPADFTLARLPARPHPRDHGACPRRLRRLRCPMVAFDKPAGRSVVRHLRGQAPYRSHRQRDGHRPVSATATSGSSARPRARATRTWRSASRALPPRAQRPGHRRRPWRHPAHPAPPDRGFSGRARRELVPAAGFGGHFIDGKSVVYPAGQSWDD